jgi:hypothetical protein
VAFPRLPARRDPGEERAESRGELVGLANFAEYFRTPALAKSIWNSVWCRRW